MTDPFEDAVRAAGRGLTTAELTSGEPTPTYHGAWKRGRRRRLAKRSGIAVAGALALVVAFGTDLGRFSDGGSTIETDDIAIASDAVPAQPLDDAPEALATTEPVVDDTADTTGAAASAVAPDLEIEPAVPDPAEVPDEAASPPAGTTEGSESTAIAPTATPTVVPAPEREPEPTVAPTPVPTVAPTPEPTRSIDASPEASNDAPGDGPSEPASTEPDDPAALIDPNEPDGSDGSDGSDDPATQGDPAAIGQTGPADEGPDSENPDDEIPDGEGTNDPPALGSTLPQAPPSTATRLGLPADARIAPDAADARDPKCDIDGDNVPDTVCELLPDYRCSGADDVRPDYQAVDRDGDGIADTCEPTLETTCDTTGDGAGDVVCRIRR